jgi:polyisoprenoid-binding protein YceI
MKLSPALLAAAFFAVAAGSPSAGAQQKLLLPPQSDISFTTRQMGVPVDGRFRKFDAQLALDPKQPQAGKFALTIDTASAGFGLPDTDVELPKAAWFNVARFPQASFQSTSIKSTGPARLEVAGKLTVKGSARDVVVPVSLAQAGGVTTATGTFTIKRLDYRIGEGEWTDTSTVADDVLVKFKLAFSGMGPL